MRLPVSLLLPMVMLAACGKASDSNTTPVPVPATPLHAEAHDAGSIPVSLANYMGSGMINQLPVVLIVEDKNVTALRHGTEAATSAMESLRNGEKVVDDEITRQEVREAFNKLLAAENKTLESITGPGGKAVILISFGPSLGECPPCTALFGPMEVDSFIGGFRVRKMTIEKV